MSSTAFPLQCLVRITNSFVRFVICIFVIVIINNGTLVLYIWFGSVFTVIDLHSDRSTSINWILKLYKKREENYLRLLILEPETTLDVVQ